MVEAINQGYPQQEIQDAAYQAQRDLEQAKSVVVGVNKFQMKEPPVQGLLRIDDSVAEAQTRRIQELRKTRSQDAATRALDDLTRAAQSPSENLMPFIYKAVKVECSLGEISNAMRKVFGEHREHVVL